MANYYATARSNYFRVKDEAAFRAAVAPFDVEIITLTRLPPVNEDDDGSDAASAETFFGLIATCPDSGAWPTYAYDEETGEDLEVDIPFLVAEHLIDGDVAVFMEAGSEKLRYVNGYAIAVNNKSEHRMIALHDIYPLARELGANVTNASY